jgi:hypothetical protein
MPSVRSILTRSSLKMVSSLVGLQGSSAACTGMNCYTVKFEPVTNTNLSHLPRIRLNTSITILDCPFGFVQDGDAVLAPRYHWPSELGSLSKWHLHMSGLQMSSVLCGARLNFPWMSSDPWLGAIYTNLYILCECGLPNSWAPSSPSHKHLPSLGKWTWCKTQNCKIQWHMCPIWF